MSSYERLKTLLDLKKGIEEQAERDLAAAIQRRGEAAGVQLALDQEVARAEEQLREQRRRGPRGGQGGEGAGAGETASAALARQRFLDRLAGAARARVTRAAAHRQGALRLAEEAEGAARTAQRAAHLEREVVEKRRERERAAARQVASRREERVEDEQAEATRATRPRDRG